MAKVKIKVSGCFHTRSKAEALPRISSHLSSIAALGNNPLATIRIAFAGNAADMIKMHDPNTPPRRSERIRTAIG